MVGTARNRGARSRFFGVKRAVAGPPFHDLHDSRFWNWPSVTHLLAPVLPSAADAPCSSPQERVAVHPYPGGHHAVESQFDRSPHHSAPILSWRSSLISSNVRSSPSSVACLLLKRSQRRTITSQYFGSSSTP